MEKKKLEEKIFVYQLLRARVESLMKQRELLIAKLVEVEKSLESLKYLENVKEGEVVFPMGSGTYLRSEIREKDRILVDVGSNVLIEKNIGEAISLLQERKKIFENFLKQIHSSLLESSQSLNSLTQEIQKMVGEKDVQDSKG